MRLIDADDAINVLTNRLFEMLKTQIPVVTATENQVCLDTCYKIAKYEIDNIPTVKPVSGRNYAKTFSSCPMCMDCPDACPLDR